MLKNILNLKTLSISKDNEIVVKGLDNISNALDKLNDVNKMKLKFNLSNLSSEFEYHGLKIIVCDEPNLLIRNLLNNNDTYSKIVINDNFIKNKYIYHIHCFSKISDVINSRTNSIFHEYLKNKDIFKIDLELQDFITSKFYSLNDQDVEKVCDINLSKSSLLDYFEISKEYIDNQNIVSLLNIIKRGANGKQLILLNDYNILNITQLIENYIDSFNFIIFTNDLKKWIKDFTYAECTVIINDFINEEFKIDSLEILDKNILIRYLEKKLKKQKNENKLFIDTFLQ